MAVRDPRKLASLTLVDAFGLEVPGARGIDPFLRSEEETLADQFYNAELAKSEITRRLTEDSEDVRIANQMVIAQLAWSPRWHDPHLCKWLHRIDVPALIVWGEQDKLVPVEHAHAWHKAIPGSMLNIIPACGHCPPLEKPDDFTSVLTSFIKEGRTPS